MFKPYFVFLLLLLGFKSFSQAQETVGFWDFLKSYQEKSDRALEARQNFSRATNDFERNTDQWQSRLTATPQIEFLERQFGSSQAPDEGFRAQDVSAVFEQTLPTGTQIELSGQKFIEVQNPLVSSVDLRYSASVTQDLFRNAFGQTQRAIINKAHNDLKLAELQLRQSIVESCDEAFELYTDTFIQQEIVNLRREQLKDAQEALSIARRLHRDRLINEIDKLSSESDFLNTQLDAEQAEQRLINNRRRMLAFLDAESLSEDFRLQNPKGFLGQTRGYSPEKATLNEAIANYRLSSQEYEVERSRTDRLADVRLGIEAGETIGRFGFQGPLLEYNDTFLRATLTIGLDLINRTEDAELKNALRIRNSFARQKQVTERTQRRAVENLDAMEKLLTRQVESSAKQVKILEEKAKVAFEQMRRARLDFENYLLHRNAYVDRKINDLNLQRDLWLNRFALQKEFAHEQPEFCEVSS